MMRFLGLFAVLAACNNGGLEAGHSPTTMGDPPTVTESAQVCLTDGSFDFHVFGDGYAAYEGRSVGAAAIENTTDVSDPDHPTTTHRRPVQMTTTVSGGAFSILCPSSLRENYGYPSYAVFIDVDGDGRCGVGDVGTEMQLYGWNMAVSDHLGVTNEWATLQPTDALQPAIGGDKYTFCAAYFP